MKLKFTLQRPGGSFSDLVATFDSTTTIADLAGYLVQSDPLVTTPTITSGDATLRLVHVAGSPLDGNRLVAESPLTSGATVALSGAPAYDDEASQAHAQVQIVAGPDVGRIIDVSSASIQVGRDPSCDIVLTDPLVSRRHARLTIGEVVEIVDLGSANGVVIGDAPVARAELRPSDVVELGDTSLMVRLLHPRKEERGREASIAFNRSPRLEPRYRGDTFTPPQPPERARSERFPLVALLAPVLMGGVLFWVTGNARSLIFIALSPLMLVGNAIESRIWSRRAFKAAVAAFDEDLDLLVEEMTAALDHEAEVRRAEQPSLDDCMRAGFDRTPLLWSRHPGVSFGDLRLGVGVLTSRSTVEPVRSDRAPRELTRRLRERLEPLGVVGDVPVVASMSQSALGVAGPRGAALPVVHGLLAQAVTLHSPSEMVIAAFVATDTAAQSDWLKWLPHSTSPHSPISARHLVSTQSAASELVSELERLVVDRQDTRSPSGLPAVLVFVDTNPPVERSRLVHLAEAGPAQGVFVVWLAPEPEALPAACRVFLSLGHNTREDRVGRVGEDAALLPVRVEPIEKAPALRLARALAPLADSGAMVNDDSDLPRAVSQLSLVGRELGYDAEVVVERWLENGSVLTGPRSPTPLPRRAGNLRAVVGQSSLGPHILDLRADGPHALVGGTTGAGKSELLQSWILGLAAAHSPQRVTFLLVDYKGGSAFADCVGLPHSIGLVTDLSPHLVRRALDSLKAELRYREELLAEHEAKDLVEMERQGLAAAPPSLVIVVDEFAALVHEVPDFVHGVVDVAQRGRSLGLHLILATQQPSGVIRGHLRANTNLRLALRMRDASDSLDVLGTDVAALVDPSLPGRAMSKSGPRALVPFQTAYAGGWTSEIPERPAVLVEELRIGSATRWEPRLSPMPKDLDRGQTDIKRLVRTIVTANQVAALPEPRKAWLPVLMETYSLAALKGSRRDNSLVYGVADDPSRQRQPTVSFNPDREGNLAVYGTGGSGKSTLLRTFAVTAGLFVNAGPCHVYGLDFGSHGLAMLGDLPHVGSIIQGSDPDRVVRLLEWLRGVVDERAGRYSKVNSATITDYRRITGEVDEPRILLLLDGVAAFRQAYEAADRLKYADMLTSIATEGRPVGVHLLLSSEQRTGVTSALASAVQRRIILRLASSDDYGLLDVPNDVLSAASPPGRALVDGLEVQVAVLGGSSDAVAQADAITELAHSMRRSGAKPAPAIRSLPDDVRSADLPLVPGRVTFAMDGGTLTPFSIEPCGTFLVSGPPSSGRSTALRTIVEALRVANPALDLHYFGPRRSPLNGLPFWSSRSNSVDEMTAAANLLCSELSGRSSDAPRAAIVIEAAADIPGTLADTPMQQLVKVCIAEDHFVLAEGESGAMTTPMGLVGLVKSSRTGLVLQPDQENGPTLMKTPFPRVRRADFPQGRGLFAAGGHASVVQVAWRGGQPN